MNQRFYLIRLGLAIAAIAGSAALWVPGTRAQVPLSRLPSWFGDPATSTRDIAVGDIDGDGDLDVVCANVSAANTLHLNSSGVVSNGPSWSVAPGVDTWAVAVGDVDGDGDLDVVFGNHGAPNTLYLNSGGALAQIPAWSSAGSFNTSRIALGDIDGDDDLDLICANLSGSNVWYRNDDGVFTSTPVWSTAATYDTYGIALGDVDGDGDLDLACGNGRQGNTLYRNAGAMLETSPFWTSAPVNDTRSCEFADINGDGALDLVCANSGQANTFYLNIGSTLSVTPTWTSASARNSNAVDLADVDGDGDVDIVFGNSNGQINLAFENRGGSISDTTMWSSGPTKETYDVALADLNGDGDLDLICANQDTSNAVYQNMGLHMKTTTSWSSIPSNNTYGVAAADVDDDGDIDVVCGNSGQSNTMYQNDGLSLSSDPMWNSTPLRSTQSVALGDVDGDGDADLVCGNRSQFNTLYYFDGSVFSSSPDWNSTTSNATQDVVLGDVDGDGDLDMVCGNSANETNTMFRNIGGRFEGDAVWLSAPTRSTSAVSLGDVDSDGDLDLVCGNAVGQANNLYLNLNGEIDTKPAWTSGEANNTFDVVLGDIDSDGDEDLVCGNQNQRNTVYLNTGDTFALMPAWRSGPANDTRSVTLADVDADGDLDLFCGNFNQVNTLYLNVGGMLSTTPIWSSTPTNSTRAVAVQDIDGDGDLDLLCGNLNQPNTLYLGTKDPVYVGDPSSPTDQLPNNAAHLRSVKIDHPGTNVYRVSFRAVDVEADPVWIVPEYHIEGDTAWSAMTLIGESSPIGPLATSPAGVVDSVDWNIEGIPLRTRHVSMRLRTTETPMSVSVIRYIPSYFMLVQPPGDIIAEPEPDPDTGDFLQGREIPVNVTMPVGAQFKLGTLYFRRGGETEYDSKALVLGDEKPAASIPKEVVGPTGVEFWAEVTTTTDVVLTDPPENPAEHPLTIQVARITPSEDQLFPARRYRMITYPGVVEVNSLYECIAYTHGPQNDYTWRAWRYDPGSSAFYRELKSGTQDEEFGVRPGRGFWFVASDNRKLGLGSSLEATSTPTDIPFAIPLQAGLSMIGNPFYFPVAWGDCLVETDAGMLAMADAGAYVGQLWAYPHDDGDYVPGVTVLQRMEAYWVECNSPVVLHVPAKKHTGGPSITGGHMTPEQHAAGWRLAIQADCVGLRDHNNYVGYAESAKTGWDSNDWRDPPMIPGDALSVYFPHADWGQRSGRYAADIRGAFEQFSTLGSGDVTRTGALRGHVWSFDVAKNFASNSAGDKVRLSFGGIESLPDGAAAFLIDDKLGRSIDISGETEYAFFQAKREFVRSAEAARFKLVVGDDEFVEGQLDRLTDTPKTTTLRQNYPNPFNPSTIVRYELASRSDVDLRIYDVNGALVKILERGVRAAGRYEVGWDGRNNSGELVASGVYFCRLHADGFTQVRKMLLLK